MLAVSVQPTPFRWIAKVVPTGPRRTSSGSAVGVIQYLPVFFCRSGVDPQAVRAAQIVGHIEAEFDMSGTVRFALGDDRGQFLPARPGHPVADDAGPVELIARAVDQSIAAHQNRLSDAGGLWHHNELILLRLHRRILPRMPFGR